MPPMNTYSHHQLHLAHPLSPSIHHQPHRVLDQKCKGVGIAGTDKMRVLLPISPQASGTGRSMRKLTAWVPACSGQLENTIWQGRLLQGELHCCMWKALAYGSRILLLKSLRICSCTHQCHFACSPNLQLPLPCNYPMPFLLTFPVLLHTSISFCWSPLIHCYIPWTYFSIYAYQFIPITWLLIWYVSWLLSCLLNCLLVIIGVPAHS